MFDAAPNSKGTDLSASICVLRVHGPERGTKMQFRGQIPPGAPKRPFFDKLLYEDAPDRFYCAMRRISLATFWNAVFRS